MTWKDILKSVEDEYKKLLEELVKNVHFFNPNIERDKIIQPYLTNLLASDGLMKQMIEILKPTVRTLEFMRPVKNDIEFHQGKDDSFAEPVVEVTYTFEVYEIKCSVSFNIRELGRLAGDKLIQVGKQFNVCVQPSGQMTKGDYLTTLVLAVKNNLVPDILKFITYTMSKEGRYGFYYGHGSHPQIFSSHEYDYKHQYIKHLKEKHQVEGKLPVRTSLMDELVERPGRKTLRANLINLGVPKDILGDW
jgi:hypothetical protein